MALNLIHAQNSLTHTSMYVHTHTHTHICTHAHVLTSVLFGCLTCQEFGFDLEQAWSRINTFRLFIAVVCSSPVAVDGWHSHSHANTHMHTHTCAVLNAWLRTLCHRRNLHFVYSLLHLKKTMCADYACAGCLALSLRDAIAQISRSSDQQNALTRWYWLLHQPEGLRRAVPIEQAEAMSVVQAAGPVAEASPAAVVVAGRHTRKAFTKVRRWRGEEGLLFCFLVSRVYHLRGCKW